MTERGWERKNGDGGKKKKKGKKGRRREGKRMKKEKSWGRERYMYLGGLVMGRKDQTDPGCADDRSSLRMIHNRTWESLVRMGLWGYISV